jgi:hypothetical protein
MNPQTPTPPKTASQSDESRTQTDEQKLDQELDRELDDTFPASDPLPWSHEVK